MPELPYGQIWHIVDGLRQGISRFAGETSVAAIVGDATDDDLYVFDPEGILGAHKTELELVLRDWKTQPPARALSGSHEFVWTPDDSRPNNVLFQVWFARGRASKRSPVLERWLGYGASRAYMAYRTHDPVVTDSFKREMIHFAPYVVAEYIAITRQNELTMHARLDVQKIVDRLGSISQALEEGSRPSGTIAFVELDNPTVTEVEGNEVTTRSGLWDVQPLPFRTEDYVPLENFKHVGKVLRAAPSGGYLLSDDWAIYGISAAYLPPHAILAEFSNGTVNVEYGGVQLCRIINGNFVIPQSPSALDLIGEYLKERMDESCVKRICEVADQSVLSRHGCTLAVVDPSVLEELNGQMFATGRTIRHDENLALVCQLAGIDGALPFDTFGRLYGFGVILHGDPCAGEDRSRGARYNSAIRFSAKYPTATMIVVSEDGPLTVIQEGHPAYRDPLQIMSSYKEPSFGWANPPRFAEWLKQPVSLSSKV
jgi:hypothetical protein